MTRRNSNVCLSFRLSGFRCLLLTAVSVGQTPQDSSVCSRDPATPAGSQSAGWSGDHREAPGSTCLGQTGEWEEFLWSISRRDSIRKQVILEISPDNGRTSTNDAQEQCHYLHNPRQKTLHRQLEHLESNVRSVPGQ